MSKTCIAFFNQGWADWESGFVLSGLVEYLGWTVQIATPDGGPVKSIGGVRAAGDLSFAQAASAPADLILVIGSDEWARQEFPAVTQALKSARAKATPIGAICAGTLAAAYAGLLDDRDHGSNEDAWFFANVPPVYKGRARFKSQATAVADRGLVTAGGSAPATFAAAVFRMVEPERAATAADFLATARAEFA